MGDSKGRWVWHEVNSNNMDRAEAYYQELFGWGAQRMDMGEAGPYIMFKAGEAMVAGLGATQGGAPSHWLSYLDVGDLDEAVARVPGLGGKVMVPPFEIPNIGRASITQDPDGATVALFEGLTGEGDGRDWSAPPAPYSVCWTEHMAHDPAKVVAYYTALMGWTAEDMGPDMKVFKLGEASVGSVRAMPAEAHGAPAHWMNYILVPEVDTYQAKSEGLGATTLKGDTEIPGMGRFAVVQDPSGAVFSLWKQFAPAQS